MPRSPLSITVPDASLFAKALGRSLKTRHAAGQPPPGHVELLNLVARALGHRNLQSLQAALLAVPLRVRAGFCVADHGGRLLRLASRCARSAAGSVTAPSRWPGAARARAPSQAAASAD